ncbi:15-hydroxyprostaglandin dehydrogenase [NAD(+)] [Choanephora cucurbitarum]|uniref:15-hydroxyprostaglandin dehydrogenase [NAD(+)] n=1 Tax=Choanephora cucurbitarum TaxID=101091 RepID=A0A1C7NCE6_9FUNG|nr:15-hydroxyprostaglandin dehydrogenase [NAD(+)] [Choanephora cucurbitarum]
MESVQGKVAVLTGAARGIGKAIAIRLVELGAKVVIGDILVQGQQTADELNEKYQGQVATFLKTDVTKYKDNKALFQLAEKQFGGVDLVVLGAAVITNERSAFDLMEDDRMMNINVAGLIKGTRVALLHLAKRGGGSIVHIASMAGLASVPNFATYCASKNAVISYTRSFTLMPEICQVRVNALCPEWVDTDMMIAAKSNKEYDPYYDLAMKMPRVPMKTVVDTALILLTDTTKNTQIMLALQQGMVEGPTSSTLDSLRDETTLSDEYKRELEKYNRIAVEIGRADLDAAMKKYFI